MRLVAVPLPVSLTTSTPARSARFVPSSSSSDTCSSSPAPLRTYGSTPSSRPLSSSTPPAASGIRIAHLSRSSPASSRRSSASSLLVCAAVITKTERMRSNKLAPRGSLGIHLGPDPTVLGGYAVYLLEEKSVVVTCDVRVDEFAYLWIDVALGARSLLAAARGPGVPARRGGSVDSQTAPRGRTDFFQTGLFWILRVCAARSH